MVSLCPVSIKERVQTQTKQQRTKINESKASKNGSVRQSQVDPFAVTIQTDRKPLDARAQIKPTLQK